MQLLLPSATAAANAEPDERKPAEKKGRKDRSTARQSVLNAGPLAKPGPAFDAEEGHGAASDDGGDDGGRTVAPADHAGDAHAAGEGGQDGWLGDMNLGADAFGADDDGGGFAFDDVGDDEPGGGALYDSALPSRWHSLHAIHLNVILI